MFENRTKSTASSHNRVVCCWLCGEIKWKGNLWQLQATCTRLASLILMSETQRMARWTWKDLIASEYCRFMGGVDLHDQKKSYYQVGRHRNKKWWKYVMMFCIDISIINSHIIYQLSEPNPVPLLDFRVELAKELIGSYCGRARRGRPRKRHVVADVSNLIERMEESCKQKECRYCQEKRKRLKAANQGNPRPCKVITI